VPREIGERIPLDWESCIRKIVVEKATPNRLANIGDTGGMTGSFIGSVLWVVGFEEHLELNAVGVLECQYRTVFALGDRRVGHAELLEPCQPLV
jgi:hypothetical protein